MVGNSCHSYDVLFRSFLGNSPCRAVNSISKATTYVNVNRMTQSVTSTEPPRCRPPFYLVVKKGKPSQKVASIWLKIGQRVAHGQVIIASRVKTCASKLLWVQSGLKLKNLDFEVASNQLKIGQRVAYWQAVIDMWGFFTCQNCCGFRAI